MPTGSLHRLAAPPMPALRRPAPAGQAAGPAEPAAPPAAGPAGPKPVGRADLAAGWLSAVTMLPQAVALATLAGLPPEMGIYASVLPVAIAALAGRARLLLSGPNTAVSILIAATLAPLATPQGSDYIGLALGLTLLVGLCQLVLALTGLAGLLRAIPDFVAQGVTLGVGAILMVSQLPTALGLLPVAGMEPWLPAWYALAGWPRSNPYALGVVAAALGCGLWAQRRGGRLHPLLAALLAGTAAGLLLDFVFGAATCGLERVGHLALLPLPFGLPALDWGETYVLKQLLIGALSIALVGGLQTTVIARTLAGPAGGRDDPCGELRAQGLGNLAAACCGGFAGSGSFNRTAAHVAAGARTPLAAVWSSVFLLLLAVLAGGAIAYIPTGAMAATLLLVGWGLVRGAWRAAWRMPRAATWATVAVGACALFSGIVPAIAWGCAAGIFCMIRNSK